MNGSQGAPLFSEIERGAQRYDFGREVELDVNNNQVPTIVINQVFSSSDEAISFYRKYAKMNGFSVRIQRCERKGGSDGQIVKKDFVCHRGNAPNRKKIPDGDTRERRFGYSVRCNCKATMRVALVHNDGRDEWRVIEFIDVHNHDLLTQNEVRHMRGHRFISKYCKSRIVALSRSNLTIRQIMSIIAEEQSVPLTGLPFTAKDVHNYLGTIRLLNKWDDATNLIITCLDFQKKDSDFQFEFEVDEDNRLRHIAWSHATSFRAYQSYGDVVLFDTTYKLNTYDMPVGIWVGITNYGSTCFFGCCLLRDEKTISFEWAFKSFLKLMNGKAPKSILTDQDLAIKDALRNVMPQANHGLCMWHIAKKFPGHLRSLLKDRYNEWKDSFWALNRLESVEAFEIGWASMVDRFELHSNSHMKDLYDERCKWAKPFLRRHFFAGMSTTGRSESMNATLKRFVQKQLNLTDFIKQVTSTVGMLDYNGEMLMTRHKVINNTMKTPHPIERHAAEILTPYAFTKYQDEIVSSFSYAAFILDIPQGFWLVRHKDKNDGGRTVYHPTTEAIHCSCKMFEYEGILCRHGVAVLVRCNAFETPKFNILHRWTRNASIQLPHVGNDVESNRDKIERLQALTLKLVNEGAKSDDIQKLVLDRLNKLIEDLPANHNLDSSERSYTTNSLTGTLQEPGSPEVHVSVERIDTPPTSNPKGRKKTKRVNGVLERCQRRRVCRVPGCGRFGHDRRNCPLLVEVNNEGEVAGSDHDIQSENDIFDNGANDNQDYVPTQSISHDGGLQ